MDTQIQQEKFWVIIVAAGSGTRFDSDIPKQYSTIHQHTIIEHSLSLFITHPLFDNIIVVLSESDNRWQHTQYANHKKITTVVGGHERYQSVLNGLTAIAPQAKANDWVLVHDAARPCLSELDLNKLLTHLKDEEVGALLACPVNDTIKKGDENRITATLPREQLWRALTPQAFPYHLLHKALQHSIEHGLTVTDEASAIEALALQPSLVEGDSRNIKITYPSDLTLASMILQEQRRL